MRPHGQPGLGVARYISLADNPTTAEAAVTVVDEQQGRGIGTILLELLATSARHEPLADSAAVSWTSAAIRDGCAPGW